MKTNNYCRTYIRYCKIDVKLNVANSVLTLTESSIYNMTQKNEVSHQMNSQQGYEKDLLL